MSRQSRNHGAPVAAATSRQNEYFVPRDGIDREVISADICRYLGNDALVRPGRYENPQTGQVVEGYFITAYRNLTTAMIDDLKADSARWDAERRAQTSRNTPGVQYRYSETHQSRQHHGPTEGPFQSDPYGPRDPGFDQPRYPGTGAPGYTGASGAYPQQQSYPPGGGGYPNYQQPSQSPQPDPRYGGSYSHQAPPQMDRGYPPPQDGQPPYVHTGANMPPRNFPNEYAGNRMPSSVAAPPQPVYATTSAPPQPGYPATTSPYQYPGQMPPTAGAPSYQGMHAQDAGAYGRGKYPGVEYVAHTLQPSQQPSDFVASPAGQSSQQPQGFTAQGQQYGEAPSSRTSAPPPTVSTTSSGASKRRSDRDDDRHTPSDRHSRPPRR